MIKKIIFIPILIVATITIVAIWGGGKFIDNNKESADYRILTLGVEGMVCPQCALAIEGFLETKEGIVQTSFSYQESNGSVVYDPQIIDKEKILTYGILRDFYQADLISDERFNGEIEEKLANISPEVEKRENKIKEASAVLQLFLSARQKEDEAYIKSLKSDYLKSLDELISMDSQIKDENEKREFRKKVLAETSDQIYLVKPALPGEPAYDIKIKAEETQIELAVNPVLKTKSVFLAGNTRLNEARELFDQNAEDEKIQTLISEYKKSLIQTDKLIKLTKEKGKEKKQLLTFAVSVNELIQTQLPKQEKLLKQILGTTPVDILDLNKKLLILAS